jgi:hypothetical protein
MYISACSTGNGVYEHLESSTRIDKPSYKHLGKKVNFDNIDSGLQQRIKDSYYSIFSKEAIKRYNQVCKNEGYQDEKIISNNQYKKYVPKSIRQYNPNYTESDKYVYSHVMGEISFNTFEEIKEDLSNFLVERM